MATGDENGFRPRELYRARIADRESEAAALQRRHVLLGYVRLALVAAGAVVAWSALYRHTLSGWWLFAICVVFALVARRHATVLQWEAEAQRAVRFFERGIARIDDRWTELPARPHDLNATGSLFADDLDLFRPGGLFDLLNTTRTSTGENALASWLLDPAPHLVILSRQHAIAELREMHALREDLAGSGKADFERMDASALSAWANSALPQIPTVLRWLAPVLVALTLGAAVRFFITDHGWPLLIMVILDATITFTLQKRTQVLFVHAERASQSLALASVLMVQWEQQKFSSPLLRQLHESLHATTQTASRGLSSLALLTRMMEQRNNFLVRALDAPLLYSVQLALAAQSWRTRHSQSFEQWLQALGDLEALESLSTYSFEHPNDPFPALHDGDACFDSIELGHPLIPESRSVRNDVSLGADTQLLLVSGSNMSGKSTLLRAVGINAVLAVSGAPVRAKSLRITPLRVGASIQVTDSLQEGRSRFYSEILRLRAICALAEEHPPVLFLLDELLDGTNSSDRLTGATGIANALLASGAIGLISTHDLALTEIASAESVVRNVHFEERIEDDEMRFDFKLRNGIVTTRNGVALMRLVGLKV